MVLNVVAHLVRRAQNKTRTLFFYQLVSKRYDSTIWDFCLLYFLDLSFCSNRPIRMQFLFHFIYYVAYPVFFFFVAFWEECPR